MPKFFQKIVYTCQRAHCISYQGGLNVYFFTPFHFFISLYQYSTFHKIMKPFLLFCTWIQTSLHIFLSSLFSHFLGLFSRSVAFLPLLVTLPQFCHFSSCHPALCSFWSLQSHLRCCNSELSSDKKTREAWSLRTSWNIFSDRLTLTNLKPMSEWQGSKQLSFIRIK